MTKRQKEGLKSLEVEINRLFERMDRREFMKVKADMEGNTAMVADCDKVLHDCEVKLAGIDMALNYIGFRRQWDKDTNKEYLVSI